jgi:hypothetical protein
MLIKRDSYKEVKVCPVCKGFGVLNPDDPSYEFDYCEECEGFGTFIDEEKGRIVFGMPLFVDFKTRKRLVLIKGLFLFAVVLIILISALVIF